jgi:hypothetical protein
LRLQAARACFIPRVFKSEGKKEDGSRSYGELWQLPSCGQCSLYPDLSVKAFLSLLSSEDHRPGMRGLLQLPYFHTKSQVLKTHKHEKYFKVYTRPHNKEVLQGRRFARIYFGITG